MYKPLADVATAARVEDLKLTCEDFMLASAKLVQRSKLESLSASKDAVACKKTAKYLGPEPSSSYSLCILTEEKRLQEFLDVVPDNWVYDLSQDPRKRRRSSSEVLMTLTTSSQWLWAKNFPRFMCPLTQTRRHANTFSSDLGV